MCGAIVIGDVCLRLDPHLDQLFHLFFQLMVEIQSTIMQLKRCRRRNQSRFLSPTFPKTDSKTEVIVMLEDENVSQV